MVLVRVNQLYNNNYYYYDYLYIPVRAISVSGYVDKEAEILVANNKNRK